MISWPTRQIFLSLSRYNSSFCKISPQLTFLQTLVGLPMDEFNDLLSKTDLSEEQLNVCRDIRRRGKNKVAAQNCRQRKIEQIEELQDRLRKASERRKKTKEEHSKLVQKYQEEVKRLRQLSQSVLQFYNKDDMNFTLQVSYFGLMKI